MKSSIIIITLSLLISVSGYAQKTKSIEAPTKTLIYKQIDTVNLKLDFYYPVNYQKSKSYPTILFFFGGGWVSGSRSQFIPHARYLASRGMLAVLADYRIANKHQTTVFEAVQDAKSAMRYLRAHAAELQIDPNKIVAAGGSAGGHLAATADLTSLDDPKDNKKISARPNALVLYNPVFDNGPTGYGYERIKERYPKISPMHNIKKGAAPTLVMLGTKDKLIPVATAELYKSKMEAVGSRCDLVLYPDQEHGFFNFKGDKINFRKTLTQTDMFLESLGYIKGKPEVEIFAFEK